MKFTVNANISWRLAYMNSEYFDEKNKKLGADKLSREEQKELFEKFVDAGGEVVKAPRSENEEASPRTKSKLAGKQRPDRRKSLVDDEQDESKSKKGGKSGSGEKEKKEKALGSETSFFDKLSLYLNALVSGVTTITGGSYKSSFISMTKVDLEKEMSNLHQIVQFILSPKKGNIKLVKGMLIQQDTFNYELLRIMIQLYQPNDFESLAKRAPSGTGNIEFHIVDQPLSNIYKKIYLFFPFNHRLKQAISYGLNVHFEYNKLGSDEKHNLENKAHKAIRFIFEEYFYKIHYAICKLVNENIFIKDEDKLDKLLNLTPEDKVDYLVQEAIANREKSSDEDSIGGSSTGAKKLHPDDPDSEENAEEFPQELIEGRDWIESLNYEIGKVTEKENKFYFETSEKMFHIYVILEEFEKEFSFILTSNKIKFNVDIFEGKKFDPKKELSDLYLGINECHDRVKDYIDIKKQMHDAKNDLGISDIHKTQKLDKLNQSLIRSGSLARTKLLDITRTIEKVLNWIHEKGNAVVLDGNAKLHFDNFDGKKKVEDKTALEIIGSCASFLGYLRYLLESGDLGGSSPNIM